MCVIEGWIVQVCVIHGCGVQMCVIEGWIVQVCVIQGCGVQG